MSTAYQDRWITCTSEGSLPDVYHLADYLDHYARSTRRYRFPPACFWAAVEHHAATAADLDALASAAKVRHRYRIAAALYGQAADAGRSDSLGDLARLREEADDLQGAEGLHRQAIDAGYAQTLFDMAAFQKQGGCAADGAVRASS